MCVRVCVCVCVQYESGVVISDIATKTRPASTVHTAICSMTQFYRIFRNRIENYLDLDLYNGLMLNINIPIESQYATSYVFGNMLVLYVTICEIFTVEICMTLTMTFRMSQGQL